MHVYLKDKPLFSAVYIFIGNIEGMMASAGRKRCPDDRGSVEWKAFIREPISICMLNRFKPNGYRYIS